MFFDYIPDYLEFTYYAKCQGHTRQIFLSRKCKITFTYKLYFKIHCIKSLHISLVDWHWRGPTATSMSTPWMQGLNKNYKSHTLWADVFLLKFNALTRTLKIK